METVTNKTTRIFLRGDRQ